jgi:hypothetical protein
MCDFVTVAQASSALPKLGLQDLRRNSALPIAEHSSANLDVYFYDK